MAVQIQLRRGLASAWTSANPTLAQGEFGVETDTYRLKLGDGTSAWNSLGYYAPGQDLEDLLNVVISSETSGQILQYNGTNWVNADIDALPDQSGNDGKYLTTDGTTATWAEITTDPNPQIFMMMGA